MNKMVKVGLVIFCVFLAYVFYVNYIDYGPKNNVEVKDTIKVDSIKVDTVIIDTLKKSEV